MGAHLSQDTLAVSAAPAASAVPPALARRPAVGSPSVPKRGRRRTGASPRADASPRAETDDDSGTDNDGDDDLAPRELFVRAAHALVQAAVGGVEGGAAGSGGVGGGAAGSGGGARAPGGYDSNEDEDFDDNMMSLGEESDGAAGGNAPAAVQPAAGAPAGGGVPPACALCTLPWELDEGDEAFYDGAHFLRVECAGCHLSFHASCLGWEAPGTSGRNAVVVNLTQRRTGGTCVVGRDPILCNRCCWQRDCGEQPPPVPDNFWSTTGAGRSERAIAQGRCLGLPLPAAGEVRSFNDRVKRHIAFITQHCPWLLDRLAVPPTPPYLPSEQLEPERAEFVAREHRAFDVSQYLFALRTCRCCGEKRPVHIHPDKERAGTGHLSMTYHVNAVECVRAGCGCRPRIYKTESDYRANHDGVQDLPPPATGVVVCATCWKSTTSALEGRRGQPFSALNGHGPMPPPHPAIAALTHADTLAIRVVVPFLQIQRLKYGAGLRASGTATTMLRRSTLHLRLPLTPEECATVVLCRELPILPIFLPINDYSLFQCHVVIFVVVVVAVVMVVVVVVVVVVVMVVVVVVVVVCGCCRCCCGCC